MNRHTIHAIACKLLRGIENNDKDESICKLIKVLGNEIQDPFAGSIDDFLIEKGKSKDKTEQSSAQDEKVQDEQNADAVEEQQEGNPKNDAVDELKEEAIDYKEPVEQDHPQEDAVEELKEEAVDYKEPVEQDHPQEENFDKVVDEIKETDENVEDSEEEEKEEKEETTLEDLEGKQRAIQDEIENLKRKKEEFRDNQIESTLKKLGDEIYKRGHSKLAARFIAASSAGIVEVLNNILRKEYLIRDIQANYNYLLTKEVTAAFKTPVDSLLYLQKQIVSLGGTPTTQRLKIPTIANNKKVLLALKDHKSNVVAEYLAAIKAIEKEDKYLTLRVMLSKIVKNKSQDGV